MIPLKTWNTIAPIYVKGTPHLYGDDTLLGAIDPKSGRMVVTKRKPGPGEPNVPVWVPVQNIACYTTVADHEAAVEEQKAREAAAAEQPSA